MNKIINILKEEKSIPLDKFINIALYDRKFGYYMNSNPFGKQGDYITSPLVSDLFGEMIAIWCIAFWENLGKPKKFLLVELGPGDGSLCKVLLNVFKNFKEFYNCLEINLLEISDVLIKIQKKNIKNKKVKWIKKIDKIKFGPIMFLGNEFFDSLAIKQVFKKNNVFLEKYISLSKDRKKLEFLYKKADKDVIKKIIQLNINCKNSIIEYPNDAILYLNAVAKNIKKYGGGLLTFDYGYTKIKGGDTLQSIKKHKFVDMLSEPGKSDITSHINFDLFVKILKKNNLIAERIVTQNEFLQKLGIIERANILSKKMTFKDKAEMFYKLKRLLHHEEMGKLFKVMFAKKKNEKFSLGFK